MNHSVMQEYNSRKKDILAQSVLYVQRSVLLILLLMFQQLAIGQTDGTSAITPQVLQVIKKDVEKLVPPFKNKLLQQNFTEAQIEFSIDTFYIQQVLLKRMNIDYTTIGMNISINEMSSAYDQLLNKYYIKLLKLLKPQDKTTLVTAQKAWLQFRDTESKLIRTLSKDEYSGGGTIQSNIVTSSYADLVVKRCIDIFNYYDNIIKGN